MDNRERIMQCAEELFYSRGYDATGVQEIADHAGITKPTLYYYFGNKRGLLNTLLETKFARLDERMKEVPGMPGGIREKLHALAQAYFQFYLEEKKFHVLMMELFYSARDNEAYQTVRPYVLHLNQRVVDVFESCQAELGNMRGRQRQFAVSIIGVINQYLMIGRDEDVSPEKKEQEEKDPAGAQRKADTEGEGFAFACPAERDAQDDGEPLFVNEQQIHALVDQFMYGIFS